MYNTSFETDSLKCSKPFFPAVLDSGIVGMMSAAKRQLFWNRIVELYKCTNKVQNAQLTFRKSWTITRNSEHFYWELLCSYIT